jgi:hypothetical protein
MPKSKAPDPAVYRRLAARVESARIALNAAADARRMVPDGRWDGAHPSFAEWKSKVDVFWAAMDAMYPSPFWETYQRLQAGDPDYADDAIAFLEADPMCQRSGYIKADFLRYLGRQSLDEAQAQRLREVILHVAATRDAREFRRYCALARKLNTPAFRSRLRELAASDDRAVRRRAGWVLDAMPNAASTDPSERRR